MNWNYIYVLVVLMSYMIFFIFYEIVYVKKNLEDLIKCKFVVSYM